MSGQEPNHQALAVYVADKATPLERMAVLDWARQLLAIQASQLSRVGKARAAVAATAGGQGCLASSEDCRAEDQGGGVG